MGRIVGIDLGTTSSRVAILSGNSPVIIENSEGEGTTPSTVSFMDNGDILVGEAARRQAIINHDGTVNAVKRLVGRRYDDPSIETLKRTASYKIIRSANGDAWIEIDGREYSPQEISSHILQKMRTTAEVYLGETVNRAVVTLPAYFNDAQRQATIAAARIAGLEVVRTISEPTAAALAYGLDKAKDLKIIAVYDLGGGTFDISILEISDGVFEVKSTNGDTFLGGEDFDTKLVEHLADQFRKEHGLDLSNDRLALQRLREAAEGAKINLSSANTTAINLPFLASNEFGPRHLHTTLTRKVFESLVAGLVDRTVEICKAALQDCKIDMGGGSIRSATVEDITEVVLIGGSTRIPLVTEKVHQFFQRASYRSLRREDAVALGAAVQAAVMSGEMKDVLLLDVAPFSLGIATADGSFVRLIERNTTIPSKRSLIFSTHEDNQEATTISVFQGERPLASDNVLIGEFVLSGIPPAPRGIPQLEVTFDVDANSVLHVFARDKASGKEQSIRVQTTGGLSDEQISALSSKRKGEPPKSSAGSPNPAHPVQSPSQPPTADTPQPERTRTLFVSYAREDLNWAERIEKALSPLTRNKKIELWFDRKIEPGEAWEKSVLSAIDRCDGALLLVSPSFLNSDYILSTELPKLFAAREQRGIFFLPIVISFCPYSLVESLTQFQMFNDPERPYSSLVDWQVDKELTRLVEEIATRAGKGKK